MQQNQAQYRPKITTWIFAITLILSICPLGGFTASAQSSSATPSSQQPTSRPPLERLYWHFLMYQNFLDRKAADLDLHGGNGDELRNRFQRKLNFSSSQFAIVRQSAQKLDADLKQKDAQAKVIIDAFHAKYPPGKVLTLPPPPPELAQLQKEREEIIQQDVADLKTQLGQDKAAKMDGFIQNDFAPTVKFRVVHTPMAPNAPTNPGQVFKAVQP